MKQKPVPERARNLLHDHPLLRKGGAHGKSRKAQRQGDKIKLRREYGPRNALGQSVAPTALAQVPA